MRRWLLVSAALFFAPSLAGCHVIAGTNDFTYEDIVGSWESFVAAGGVGKHTATMYGNGEGEGVFVIGNADSQYWPYAVAIDWAPAGASYEVRVVCDDPNCFGVDDDSLVTLCQYLAERDQLRCDPGDSGMTQAELTFIRVDD